MSATGIGAAVRRKEDHRFITGKGHYTDDISRPGQTYAYFVRSPHAHATIKSIDTKTASGMPGVVAVLTGAELAADKIGNLICGWMIHSKDGSPMKMAPHPALASGKVCHVGDAVAVVVAETLAQARDAAEKVKVDYAVLPAVSDPAAAQKQGRAANSRGGAEQHHLSMASRRPQSGRCRVQVAPSTSPSSTSSITGWCRTPWSRAPPSPNTIPAPVTSRCGIPRRIRMWRGWSSPPSSAWRPSISSASSPPTSAAVSARRFSSIPKKSWRCGPRGASERPVKWTSDRSEAFLTDAHGRDHVTHAEMAFDADGKIVGLRAKTIANLGAYMSTFSSSIPTYLYATLLSGQYDIPQIYCEVDAVYTNTVPVDAYRGAGRPEATFVVERLVEVGAREMGKDPAELRRKNFIKTFPHQTPVIMTYDAGDYDASLEEGDGARRLQRLRQAQARIGAPRQAARHRLLHLHRSLRHRAVAGRRLARRRRRPVGVRRGAGQSDRLGGSPHRLPRARPGPRDHVRAARFRAARHSDRQRFDRAWRHRQGAVRHGHLRFALGRGRHVGDRQGARQGRGQGQEGRRPHARSRRRRHRVQGRQVQRRRHRQVRRLGRRRAQRLYRAQILRPASSSPG